MVWLSKISMLRIFSSLTLQNVILSTWWDADDFDSSNDDKNGNNGVDNDNDKDDDDNDDNDDDIYIMMQCLCVCHEKWSLS